MYKMKRVQAHLWKQGGKILESMNRAASEAGVPMEWGGYPPIPMFKFNVGDPTLAEDLMTLWLQENARRGILYRRGGPAYICFSHNDEDIRRTIEAGIAVIRVIKAALDNGDVRSKLEITKLTERSHRKFA